MLCVQRLDDRRPEEAWPHSAVAFLQQGTSSALRSQSEGGKIIIKKDIEASGVILSQVPNVEWDKHHRRYSVLIIMVRQV